MIPEPISNYAFNKEAMILEGKFNIINGLQELLGIMVTAQDIIDVPVP